MSSNLYNFSQLNVTENCSNITQIAPVNTGDVSHHMHHTQKRDANTEYWGRIKMVLSSCMGGITFSDPANIRKAHIELVIQVRTESIHISNKCRTQIEPIHLEWDRFLPTSEKDFPEILNEVLTYKSTIATTTKFK